MSFNDDEEPPPTKPGPARPGGITGLPTRQVQLSKYHNPNAPMAPNDQQVLLELKGISSAASRAPLDLVAVIDVSGSMEGDKLENAKKALCFIIRKLTDRDRLCIVQFDHEVTRLCPLRCATEAVRADLEALVCGLKARGATNIKAGLETSLRVVNERKLTAGRAANIMLMSDGQHNEGDWDPNTNFDPLNMPVHTFGFGRDHDSIMLGAIAKKSLGGVYNFVDDSDKLTNLSETFSQILAGLVTIIAQDLELTVTPVQGEATIKKVDAGTYQLNTSSDGSSSVTVKFGTLYSTEERSVIVELALSDRTAFDPYRADVAVVQYRFTAQGQQVTSNPERITIDRSWRKPDPDDAPPQLLNEVTRRQHADSIREAMEMADVEKLEDARSKLAEALKALDRIVDPMVDMLRKELLKLLELFTTKETYKKQGRPYAISSLASHGRQRSAARGDAEDVWQHADTIRAAMKMADGGKLHDARNKLAEALKALDRIVNPMADMLRKELLKLLELFKTKETYQKQGRPYAISSLASHDRQRFAARGDPEDVRLFATRRMDTYLEQAKQLDEKPEEKLPSADDDVQEEPEVSQDVPDSPTIGERRTLSVALRVLTAVLSLLAFSIMASARTSGPYRYDVGVNVIVCFYSVAQVLVEIRRLVSPMLRSTSYYWVTLFLDQVLAYLLMSASSAAASRNRLWVSRFGTDPFSSRINTAVWFSFVGFPALSANALISMVNLFSKI
ncbi:uncharacterized protein LOC133900161 [Phragmites australis]|uniref:uncharacterized protein LOC133900161 n=1 Tax=Phragmites australis TaxID=29695 RepID=UPI002D767796|nr:uncharacterized protein LOC133900161 [Phragmites australis]